MGLTTPSPEVPGRPLTSESMATPSIGYMGHHFRSHIMNDWDSTWYRPGNWALPRWWTDGVVMRTGFQPTTADQQYFYNGPFVRNVLNHTGGMTTLPPTTRRV